MSKMSFSSKVVQVKSNVKDPDFPDFKLADKKLSYVKSVDSDRVLFKFISPSKEYIKMCKEYGLDHTKIELSRSDVRWHEKDWVNESSNNLSCYEAVKARRRNDAYI
mgnify:CR=1 FL=1